MADDIKCPNCGHDFALTDTLAAPLRAKMQADYNARLAEERAAIEQAAKEAATKVQAERLAEMQGALAEANAKAKSDGEKLAQAQKAQAEALRKERDIAAREAALDLAVEQKLNASLKAEQAKLKAQADAVIKQKVTDFEEAQALKLTEKDTQMEALRRQIDELKQRAETGSQQLQGEAAELVLEDTLARHFPMDEILPVPKGIRGADCLQQVAGAGAILWESKRTANWAKDWLPKLRTDMRAAGAELGVLVSEARPDGVETFALVDGIWVAAPRFAVPLAAALREALTRVAEARGAREGQATKTEVLYDYLTGPQFRSRIEAVVEPFDAMQQALATEKKMMQRQWATREKQMELAIAAMMGMYGDVKGIAGASLPEIAGLDVPLLDEEG